MRILIVDDEEMIRELVRATLSGDARFELNEAPNGEVALEVAAEWHPDLVILDVRMPGLDGVETCEALREQYGPDRPVIVMLTALGQDADLQRYDEAGANGYFIKPFSPRALLEHVYGLFDLAA